MDIVYNDPYRPGARVGARVAPWPWEGARLERVAVVERGAVSDDDRIAIVLRAPNAMQLAIVMSGRECYELLTQIFATGFAHRARDPR